MNSPALPYTLFFEERPHYLYVRVTADRVDPAIAMSYLTEIAKRFNGLSQKKLMLERCIPAMLPDEDLKKATLEFFEMIGHARAALVNPYLSFDGAIEAAMLMGSMYGVNFRLFNDPILAEEWLLEPDATESL
ncbi:MAG: hypothetical protein QM785_06010 [Pyrinomonadaceae bacterium]